MLKSFIIFSDIPSKAIILDKLTILQRKYSYKAALESHKIV